MSCNTFVLKRFWRHCRMINFQRGCYSVQCSFYRQIVSHLFEDMEIVNNYQLSSNAENRMCKCRIIQLPTPIEHHWHRLWWTINPTQATNCQSLSAGTMIDKTYFVLSHLIAIFVTCFHGSQCLSSLVTDGLGHRACLKIPGMEQPSLNLCSQVI